MREVQGIAAGAIANAMASLLAGRRMGVRLTLPEDLLRAAQSAAIRGDFSVALELASRSGEEAETLTIAFEALQGRLRKARLLIARAQEEGADMTEASSLLDMASGAADAGDYRGALRYAIKSAQRAEERRSGVTAWKVEIGDWLK
jgi:thioredoxin-like negative regulator of GroEL